MSDRSCLHPLDTKSSGSGTLPLRETRSSTKDFSALCLKNPSADVFQGPITRNFCIQGMEVRTEQKVRRIWEQINEIIKASIAFGDVELVRREMFQYKFIGRLRDGSEYWAEPEWREAYEQFL